MRRSNLSLILTIGLCIHPAFGKELGVAPNDARLADNPPPTEVEVRDPQAFFDETFNELEQELEIAQEEGKSGLLIMFEMDDCPFCYRMKQTVLNRGDVQDYYRKHFRIISVDIEGDLELTDFQGKTTTQKEFALKQHRVRATPVFLFFDLEGNPVRNGRLTGATKNAGEFLLLGRYIVERHNDSQSFFRFKREQAKSATDEQKG
ncbi:MAG: thioredoxin family protein [Pseudomonadota bacterium]|nr:thioredoxin family protein [Pseudomonadota bacterium]